MCSYPMALAPDTCKQEGPDNKDGIKYSSLWDRKFLN